MRIAEVEVAEKHYPPFLNFIHLTNTHKVVFLLQTTLTKSEALTELCHLMPCLIVINQ